MTPEEFAELQRQAAQRNLEQVAMLQRIAGYLHVIEWAVIAGALFLLLIVLK